MTKPRPSGCNLGPCLVCSRPLHDEAEECIAHIAPGIDEVVCGPCFKWSRRIARRWLVKTRRLPGRDTPAAGTPRAEPPARRARLSL